MDGDGKLILLTPSVCQIGSVVSYRETYISLSEFMKRERGKHMGISSVASTPCVGLSGTAAFSN